MKEKKTSFIARWMLSRLEIAAIVGIIVLTLAGLFVSIQDALQLEQTLNLHLTQTVILTQGIVNLQRDVQLTRNEVSRLLGNLDDPPKQISRFDFVEIQVNNLSVQAESPEVKIILTAEDQALIADIQQKSTHIEPLIAQLNAETSPEEQQTTLRALDTELESLEVVIKQLVDRQATAQRDAITQTRDSMTSSQRTALVAGTVLLLMGVALAVVVRRALASRLQRALESERFKGQLLNSVSHELRTPIAAIRGYSQLMGEEAYGSLNEKQKTTIKRILINTTQLQGMVNNLLDRAQMDQGKLTVRKAPFMPADLIETARSALNVLAQTQGLELTSEITPDVPNTLIGDELRLQQILFNLISNALKFTQKGSVCARIFMHDKTHWALQVVDTGIGIPTEAQAHIFESFWQVDSSATRQYRGSGLGLSIVKQLVELMDGSISLTSHPGQGSTFTVIFPLESEL